MSSTTNKTRKIIVTQALPYANASLHLGHILEAVQTDIWSRFQNKSGNECLFFCADDTHGTPVMLKAKELGISPEDLIKDVQKDHEETYKLYDINFTNYHTTHSDENKKYSEKIYLKAKENKLITRKTINQLFDEAESMFLSDRFVKGTCPKCGASDQYGDGCTKCGATYDVGELKDPVSAISGTKPINKESEHVFFDLPKKLDVLKNFLASADLQKPITNKLNEWLNDDLHQWDISRDAPYFGFKIPEEEDKYFYVWLDAPIGYIASIDNWATKNNKDMDSLWSADSDYEIYHFIGKDISYFHGLFWPALLSGSDLKLPNGIYVHGFLTINGEKMSKSKGTGILAKEFAELCDPETLRYYFAAKLNDKVEDIDLNFEDYVQRINSDLVGKYLNIASRCSSFIEKNSNALSSTFDNELIEKAINQKEAIEACFESRNYSKAVRLIMDIADLTNKYINDNTPWKKDIDEAAQIATTALNVFNILSIYLSPIIPNITSEAFKFLNQEKQSFNDIELYLKNNINKYKPLLKRLEPIVIPEEKPMSEEENYINIDQFADIDLRVAKIKNASHVDGADKLLQLTLDVGDLGERNVFAGIKKAYDPESIVGKMVILVSNLAPRQMKFGLSEGMVLASSDDEGIYLISPDSGATPGLRVK
ncbi:methionine--tRNA ligase [Gammaproteobacteria bacterium]|nr:methionine--tRNA ligase [Gammaproteobacteria bacterium]MDB2569899.1 methionine--tRNA ligase [Gammaproteobacteria bacterium]MDC3376342.1 methionine--tRNA ligase [Gammaproteobacteria bacterium]